MTTKNNTSYHAAIYVRRKFKDVVAKDEENPTTAEQVKRIKELREEFPDISIDGIYMDRKKLNQNDPRPEFFRFLKDLHNGHYNCVILYGIDTFGKDYDENAFYLLKQFPMLGLRIIIVHDNYDSTLSEPVKDTYQNLIPLVDRFRKNASSRKRTIRHQANLDTLVVSASHVPFGYLYRPDIPACVEIDPVSSPAVKLIFEEFITGTPIRVIAKMLDEAGYSVPAIRKRELGYWKKSNAVLTEWSDSAIKEILCRRFYTGDYESYSLERKLYHGDSTYCNKEKSLAIIEDHHPALISHDMFEKAQILFKTFYTERKRGPQNTYMNVSQNIFLNQIYCQCCGTKLVHTTYYLTDKNSYGLYRCASVRDHQPDACQVPSFRDDELMNFTKQKLAQNKKEAMQFLSDLTDPSKDSVYHRCLNRLDNEIAQIVQKLSEDASDQQTQHKDQLLKLLEKKQIFFDTFSSSNPWLQMYQELPEDYMLTKGLLKKYIDRIEIAPDQDPIFYCKNENFKDNLLDLYAYANESLQMT